MTVLGRELVPTQSALLELRAEHAFIREGHEFLDQKRILLAGEIKRLLERYDALRADFAALNDRAVVALAEALARHGLDELSILPTRALGPTAVRSSGTAFLGVPLVVEAHVATEDGDATRADLPSPEERAVRELFREMIARAVEISEISGNIERLTREYVRTERRARALENVILPELGQAIAGVAGKLAEQQQEDAVRARLHRYR